MLTPVHVNLRYWFYPIGNTPAVNFMRNTRCEKREPVKILSLACGDPRNILYTVWCEQGLKIQSRYEITTCDIDPAVLARNVMLFTLLGELSEITDPSKLNKHKKSIWNIFYHLFIPDGDVIILQDHAKRLWDASISIAAWMSSTYSKYIGFLSESTLVSIRNYWSKYAETREIPSAQTLALEQRTRTAIDKIFQEKIGGKGIGMVLHGNRSAGAHFANSVTTMSAAFEGYWKTGVVGGNKQDEDSLGGHGKGHVNPMFATSSAPTGKFALHYGSDPLLGFHLAEVFDTAKPEKTVVDRVVHLAKSQFYGWCDSFRKSVEDERLKIILHCGDAVSFCHGLQSQNRGKLGTTNIPSLLLSPWKYAPLVLDGPDCTPGINFYDVIDTSNVADHVGILNLLPAAVPLLGRKSTSALYVETLLLASEDPSRSLQAMLCSDVSTMCLLLGISPTGHLLGVTTESIGSEAFDYSFIKDHAGVARQQQQYRMCFPWKVPELGDLRAFTESQREQDSRYRISFEPGQLGRYFFNVYLKMFAYEDWHALMSSTSSVSAKRQLLSPLSGDLRYYTRLSLVVLMRLAKCNITTSWAQCMEYFLDKVKNDKTLPIGLNSLQELLLNLHIYGVWEDKTMMGSFLNHEIIATTSTRSKSLLGFLFKDRNPPPVVYIALVVPRNKLRIFTDESPDTIGTPGLHISVGYVPMGAENSFHAIGCCFGNLISRGDRGDMCDVEECELGWAGSADLVVMCAVPAYTLLLGEADSIRVSLVINTNPSTLQFTMKLGFSMAVYGCSLTDKKRLWLLGEPPGTTKGRFKQSRQVLTDLESVSIQSSAVTVDLNYESEATRLGYHIDIPRSSDESQALANSASVVVHQASPCTMALRVGATKPRCLVYPFPINGSVPKIRIARKSSWVEVSVLVAPALNQGGYNGKNFPVVFGYSQPSVWGISLVNVQQQSSLKVAGNFNWLQAHLGLTLSAKERVLNTMCPPERPPAALLDLKESMNILFQSFVGRNPEAKLKPINSFNLVLNANIDTLIFSNAICHDRNTSSILMDAYVVPISPPRLLLMKSALRALRPLELLSIKISEGESALWKQLMPCLVERCRVDWTHQPDCQYKIKNQIPLSTAHGESPICSCGEGKSLDGYPKYAGYEAFKEFATRIAIAPIFAVPYVEPLISEASTNAAQARASATQGPTAQRPTETTATAITKCDHCGAKKVNLKACTRCGKVQYCNHDCQKAAWKEHKKVCNK